MLDATGFASGAILAPRSTRVPPSRVSVHKEPTRRLATGCVPFVRGQSWSCSGPFVLPMGLRLGISVGKTCPARGPRDPGAEGCFADILAC